MTQGTFSLYTLSDFIDSVRWSEPFIVALVLMQILIAFLLYFTRRHHDVQFAILVVLTGVTLLAERLNRLGKTHWSSFASQDYFDANGLFMLVFVTAPFVIYANFIVVRFNITNWTRLCNRPFSFSFFRFDTNALVCMYLYPSLTPLQIRMALRLVKLYALKARRQTRQSRSSSSSSGVTDAAAASHQKQS